MVPLAGKIFVITLFLLVIGINVVPEPYRSKIQRWLGA